MKFLLVALNAKYIHSNPAIYSLRRYAGEMARYVELAEYTINNRVEEILEDIYDRKPEAAGFSCYIWNREMILELITELHKLLPELPIWLGGPEASLDAERILEKYPSVTGIMAGEGEETFAELLSYYVTGKGNLQRIAGLVLRDGATARRELLSLTEIPFLYEDTADFENRIIYYESQRGCPFSCSYCLSSIDKKVRFRDIGVVKQELQFFLEKRVKQVKFVDRTFNCNYAHAAEIWRYIKEHDNGVTNFHFEVAGDILNDEEIALLNSMRAGLVQLEIGVQSANTQTLAEIRRVTDMEKLKAAVAQIRRGGRVHQHLDLIAGLPFEDYESFGRSFDVVYAMQPNQLQLGFLKVLKGSYLYEKAKDYGLAYTDTPPYEVLYSRWISYAEIRRLKKIEQMVEIYYNSSQFTHILSTLQKSFQSPFAMYEALADYYAEKGFFTETPSRLYRYEILLSFAQVHGSGEKALYRELLVFDFYLREKAKSRPDFAGGQDAYKKEITAFYKREETERRYLPEYGAYDSRQLERMTHLEQFYYSVWENEPERREACYVLFDYQKRSPLTYEAAATVILKNEFMTDVTEKETVS